MNAGLPEVVLELESASLRARDGGRDAVVLDGACWRVRRGEAWLVTGGMGSGKTVLLEALSGLRPLDVGTLRVFGVDVGRLRGRELASVRRRAGMVFEGRGRLIAGMTVLENVALPACYHGNLDLEDGAREVGGWLEELGIAGMAGERAGRLGPSWSRRVALARALVMRPELLLLDDPLAGLDPAHARWWKGFLGRLRDGHPRLDGRPVTLVMTTGAPSGLMGVAGRCALMGDGRLHDVGGPGDLASREEAWLRAVMAGD